MYKDRRLEILRERWRKEPDNRKVIELQARAIKLSLSLKSNKKLYGSELVETAKAIFDVKTHT